MRRVVILGCSGSGKSTPAVRMGERLGLSVVHLDRLYWRPGWQKPDSEGFRARAAAALAGDFWVCEGNYRETFDLRLPRADAVIALERPRLLCLGRVLWRELFQRNGRVALLDGCPQRLDRQFLLFVWRFARATWPGIEAARIEHGTGVPAIRLRSNRESDAFLATLPRSPP